MHFAKDLPATSTLKSLVSVQPVANNGWKIDSIYQLKRRPKWLVIMLSVSFEKTMRANFLQGIIGRLRLIRLFLAFMNPCVHYFVFILGRGNVNPLFAGDGRGKNTKVSLHVILHNTVSYLSPLIC
jgi:hypothetical protein